MKKSYNYSELFNSEEELCFFGTETMTEEEEEEEEKARFEFMYSEYGILF